MSRRPGPPRTGETVWLRGAQWEITRELVSPRPCFLLERLVQPPGVMPQMLVDYFVARDGWSYNPSEHRWEAPA